MNNPDLPPDSITTLPAEQRTAAIRERYNDWYRATRLEVWWATRRGRAVAGTLD